jgi:hypothetical protein
VKLYCRIGVLPLGAQVRTRCGRSLTPDSSTKTTVRPYLAQFMEWPAPPSGGVDVVEDTQPEERITGIAVLGIDIGKNPCSVVGLNDTGEVVLRRRVS